MWVKVEPAVQHTRIAKHLQDILREYPDLYLPVEQQALVQASAETTTINVFVGLGIDGPIVLPVTAMILNGQMWYELSSVEDQVICDQLEKLFGVDLADVVKEGDRDQSNTFDLNTLRKLNKVGGVMYVRPKPEFATIDKMPIPDDLKQVWTKFLDAQDEFEDILKKYDLT